MWRRLHDDEQGIAMVTVLGLSLVLALLVTALLQYGMGSLRQARHDQDWHASLAAANGGIDDFVARINRDIAYWREADDCTDCTATLDTLDPDNPALTAWATIPGGQSEFRYDVYAEDIGSTGVIVVTSTGRVNGVERTIRAQLRRRTFLDYLYFTEYETLDPIAYSSGSQQWAAENCTRHRYDNPPRADGCTDIYWASGDTVDGPFHTNDEIAVLGNPSWQNVTTTSRLDAKYWDEKKKQHCRFGESGTCSSNPSFAQGLRFTEPLTLPPSNIQIKVEADPAATGQGCMYVGATFLRFNSNGSVTVKSAKTDDPSSSKCPIDGTMASLPPNGVIYVRAAKPDETCLAGNPHPYITTGDVTPYDRCAGDVYVEGTLDGRVTVAAENNIIISDDIRYAGGRTAASDDMLGLVANNFVEIMHPVDSGGNNISYLGGAGFTDPRIDAAVLSIEHSFRVQNHGSGSRLGTIDLYGTIAQLYRGPVGIIGSHGYSKDYKYDPRLEFVSPPQFLDPVQSAWGVRSVSEE